MFSRGPDQLRHHPDGGYLRLGLDVGSTTAKLIALDREGGIAFARARRHRGRPVEVADGLLREAETELASGGFPFGRAPTTTVEPHARIAVTGSIGSSLAPMAGGRSIHEVHALIAAVRLRDGACNTVIELGGQDAKLLLLDARPPDAQMNDRCAAGTGATIDRVAHRLGLSEDELGRAHLVGDLLVAAKCGVFAETDIINLVKRGATPQAALGALARAIVVQNLAVLARGKQIRPPVLLLGGPHAHLPILAEAWVEAMADLGRRNGGAGGPVYVPSHAIFYAAIGAAMISEPWVGNPLPHLRRYGRSAQRAGQAVPDDSSPRLPHRSDRAGGAPQRLEPSDGDANARSHGVLRSRIGDAPLFDSGDDRLALAALRTEEPAVLRETASDPGSASSRSPRSDDDEDLIPTRIHARSTPRRPRAHYLGIDAGSSTVKAVLLDADGGTLTHVYGPSEKNPIDDVRDVLAELWRRAERGGISVDLRATAVTGYGAELVAPLIGVEVAPVETLAHARAAVFAATRAGRAPPEVVVDVGGTDIKVLELDGERIRRFHISNQCSAGHGAFLAATAADLDVPLDQFANRALGAKRAPVFTVGCAIFMDTDRVTYQRDGYDTDEILAGLAWALARNVWEFVVPESPERLGRHFLLTGGAQRNLAVAWAQAKYLRARVPTAEVMVHPTPELCGAIGAGLIARDRGIERDQQRRGQHGVPTRDADGARRPGPTLARSAFIGLDALASLAVSVATGEDLRCNRCEVGCSRSLVETVTAGHRHAPAARLWIGNACERGRADGGDDHSPRPRRRHHAADLFAEEARRLFRPATIRSLAAPARRSRGPWPVIGLPRVMALYRSAPLLLGYLRGAGVPEPNLVLTPPTSASLYQDGARWGANDPCFPSKLVLAHVDWLLRHRQPAIDTLFMPTITHAAIAITGTADTASCPIVAASGYVAKAAFSRSHPGAPMGALEKRGVSLLAPELCLIDRARLDRQLFASLGSLLDLTEEQHQFALAAGLSAQQRFHQRCRQRGMVVLNRVRAEGRCAVVILARPYHADPGVQHGLSTELAARGLPVLSIASLPIADTAYPNGAQLDIGDILPELTNSGCAEKIWAARLICRDPNLVAVDLSSFRCGQDASTLGELVDILDGANKPTLYLHDLDEDRQGGSFRLRIETFVRTVERYVQDHLQGGDRRADGPWASGERDPGTYPRVQP